MPAGEPYETRPRDGPNRAEILYQRHRQTPDRLNNSLRRTYDLLRSAVLSAGRDVVLDENQLTDALSASRSTVRAVLQQLAREGLVTRGPRHGTRSTGALMLPATELRTVAQFSCAAPVVAQTLDCRSLGRPAIVADRLLLREGSSILMIENLLVQNETPIGLTVDYIAVDNPQTAHVDAAGHDVISILEPQLGVRIGVSRTTVGAVAADEQTATLVDVDVGAPLVWLEDVIEDSTGQPQALSQMRFRSDRVAFHVTAQRSA